MSILTKVGIVAGLVIALLAGIWSYGRYEHKQGWSERDTAAQIEAAQLLAQARTKEQAAKTEMEKVRNEAYQQKQVADMAIASAANESIRLRDEIARQTARANIASATAGTDGTSARGWKLFDACRIRYEDVARDSDRYVERLRIGQGWAGAVQK